MDSTDLVDRLRAASVPFEVVPEQPDMLSPVSRVLNAILPTLILLSGMCFLLWQATEGSEGGRGSSMKFAKSRDVNFEPKSVLRDLKH
jgi:ATP-dependent Zn protease